MSEEADILDLLVAEEEPGSSRRLEEELFETFERAIDRWKRSVSKLTLDKKLFPQEYRDVWIQVFLKYNTSLPSSAAVERIFSTAGDIIRPKRSSLSSSNFEELVFWKGNLDLL